MPMNIVCLKGNLGHDPDEIEPKEQKKGKAKAKRLCKFDVAFGTYLQMRQGNANWITIWCKNAVADRVLDIVKLKKGDQIAIFGQLESKYREIEGEKIRWASVWAFYIEILKAGPGHEGRYMEDEAEIDVAKVFYESQRANTD